jgi:hypothetical protein
MEEIATQTYENSQILDEILAGKWWKCKQMLKIP